MSKNFPNIKGMLYYCPICGAEIIVSENGTGELHLRCCNTDMIVYEKPKRMYRCPICKSEIALVEDHTNDFLFRCCDVEMELIANE